MTSPEPNKGRVHQTLAAVPAKKEKIAFYRMLFYVFMCCSGCEGGVPAKYSSYRAKQSLSEGWSSLIEQNNVFQKDGALPQSKTMSFRRMGLSNRAKQCLSEGWGSRTEQK